MSGSWELRLRLEPSPSGPSWGSCSCPTAFSSFWVWTYRGTSGGGQRWANGFPNPLLIHLREGTLTRAQAGGGQGVPSGGAAATSPGSFLAAVALEEEVFVWVLVWTQVRGPGSAFEGLLWALIFVSYPPVLLSSLNMCRKIFSV